MSRMTKFLRQRCTVERYVVENGQPKLNMFGELQYQPPVTLKCRCEASHKDVQTANGSVIRATTVYYLDDTTPIMAGYRVDGHVVVSVTGYVNSQGLVEGYEVYV